MRSGRRGWVVVAAMAVVAATVVGAGPASGAAEVLTVTPATGLVDGQAVTVEGTGFDPFGSWEVFQCPAAAVDTGDCFTLVGLDIAADGSFSLDGWVLAVLEQGDGTVVADCRDAPGTCEVRMTSPGGDVAVPLAFDPAAPLRPLPTLEVVPATQLSFGQVVTVRGADVDPWADPVMAQCAEGDLSFSTCDLVSQWDVPSADGTFEVGWSVGTIIETFGGRVDCRDAPGACVLVAGLRVPPDAVSRPVSVPLTFAEGAAEGYAAGLGDPPPPPPPLPAGHGGTRYLDEVFADVERIEDLVFWPDAPALPGVPVTPQDLTLDLVLPAGDAATDRPVLIAFEGGKDAFARRGYVVAEVGANRARPLTGSPDPAVAFGAIDQGVVDAAAAVRWLRAHADDYGIDGRAIAATGLSYGGILSFGLAWGLQNEATSYTYTPPPGPVTVPAGGLDLGPVAPDQPSQVAAAVPEVAWFPPELIDPGEPPVLLQSGDYDDRFPLDTVAPICPAAAAVGVVCELRTYPLGHGLDFYRPQVDDAAAVFLYSNMIVPLGIGANAAPVAGPTIVAGPAPATAVAAQPAFTG